MTGFIATPMPYTVLTAAGSGVGTNPAFPADNLLDDQPKTVFETNVNAVGAGSYHALIDVDLGSDVGVDTIAILHTNVSSASTVQIYSATAAAGLPPAAVVFEGAFGPMPLVPGRRHALWTVPVTARITARYLRIYVNDTTASNPERLIRIGNLVVATKVEPAFNFELGSGRRFDDQSEVRITRGGQTFVDAGGIVPMWRGVWSNLSDVELRSIDAFVLRRGLSRPVLVVSDQAQQAGLPEAIHWGLLANAEFYDRSWPDKNRVEIVVREFL